MFDHTNIDSIMQFAAGYSKRADDTAEVIRKYYPEDRQLSVAQIGAKWALDTNKAEYVKRTIR